MFGCDVIHVTMFNDFGGGGCQQEVPLDKIVISWKSPGFEFEVGIYVWLRCYSCYHVQ